MLPQHLPRTRTQSPERKEGWVRRRTLWVSKSVNEPNGSHTRTSSSRDPLCRVAAKMGSAAKRTVTMHAK